MSTPQEKSGPPSVVVFDLGKVLVDFRLQHRGALPSAPRTRLPAADLQTLLCTSPLFCQYETGVITTAQFHCEVCAASGLDMGLEDFSACFANIFFRNPAYDRDAGIVAGKPAFNLDFFQHQPRSRPSTSEAGFHFLRTSTAMCSPMSTAP